MWILILTLVASGTSVGQTITAVNGFSSEQSCIAAGAAWQKKVQESATYRVPIAVCAKA